MICARHIGRCTSLDNVTLSLQHYVHFAVAKANARLFFTFFRHNAVLGTMRSDDRLRGRPIIGMIGIRQAESCRSGDHVGL